MWFKKKREEPTEMLGTYLDALASTLNARVAAGPSQEWLDAYNEKALAEKLGLSPIKSGLLGLLWPTPKALEFPPTPLVFTPDMPSVFWEDEPGKPYRGNDAAKERIDVRIHAMRAEDRVKFLFTGPAGTGKTTLAWITAFRIMVHRHKLGVPEGRFFELLASQIENKAQWDEFMRQVQPYDIIFMDELHVLQQVIGVEALYHVLADTGAARYPLGNGEGWIELPTSVCWMGATTEPGKLDTTNGGALRRRLDPEIVLEAPATAELAAIVQDQDMPVLDDAAMMIAERSGGLPWQALSVFNEARAVARGKKKSEITEAEANRAFTIMGVDEHGLTPNDRRVLQILMKTPHRLADGRVVYRMNEAALCAAAGLDRETYKQRVQPKLMRMSFLTTVGGQSLTDKALDEYGHLTTT